MAFSKVIKKIFKTVFYFPGTMGRKYGSLRHQNEVILVYTMGKVGSSSVYEALKKSLPGTDIYHIHFLSDKWLKEKLPAMDPYYHVNIRAGSSVRDYLRLHPGKKILIVTLVREPVMREVSNLFENWRPKYEDISTIPVEQLSREINESSFDYVLNWFDDEFREYLGFDIYQTSFAKEKGYQVYDYNNMKLLCIKLERLNEVCSPAFEEFMQTKIQLLRENQSEFKKGSAQYLKMKNTFTMGDSKLSAIYNSKFVRHFYSEEEIKKFMNKWLGGP